MSDTNTARGRVSSAPPRHDMAIQSLRGIAVTLMVIGHVIGIPGHGLRVSDDSAWRNSRTRSRRSHCGDPNGSRACTKSRHFASSNRRT